MGNGASVPLSRQSYEEGPDFKDKFSRLEKRVRSGFFERAANEEEYLRVTTDIIEKQQLDMLELLIKGGDLKSLCPLHIAAKSSSIEAMDLLLSAGFSPFDTNLQGKTPLHQAASSRKEEAVLCAYLLLMHGEKALKMKDKNGNTPLHIAVMSNNATIVENMLTFGASLSVTNNAGKSPRNLAKSMKHDEILDIIDEKRTGKLRKKKDYEQGQGQLQSGANMTKHQQERIMKVWEKFFENALMGVDFELDDDGDDKENKIINNYYDSKAIYREYENVKECGDRDNKLANVLFQEDFHAQNSLYPSDSKDYNYNFTSDEPEHMSYQYDEATQSYYEVYKSSSEKEPDKDRVFRCASEWFSWVLAYEHDPERRLALALTTGGDGTDGYYTANCFALDHQFDLLDDHLDRLDQYGLWQGYDVANIASNKDESYGSGGYSEVDHSYAYYFPGSIQSAIAAGWINFFDVDTNTCCWMHIPSGLTESYLPLGDDLLAWDLGLEQHFVSEEEEENGGEQFDTECWLKPPQVVARSWVMVSIQPSSTSMYEEKDEKETETEQEILWYFSNRVTGHSSWVKPAGWDQLMREADGWVLCAEEETPEALYW